MLIGSYRFVIFAFGLAFKFPRLSNTKLFLLGLLSNLQERKVWKQYRDKTADVFFDAPFSLETRLNPTYFTFPLGLFSVQPEVKSLAGQHSFNEPQGHVEFDKTVMYVCSANSSLVEGKIDSFGVTSTNKLRIVDYGGNWNKES